MKFFADQRKKAGLCRKIKNPIPLCSQLCVEVFEKGLRVFDIPLLHGIQIVVVKLLLEVFPESLVNGFDPRELLTACFISSRNCSWVFSLLANPTQANCAGSCLL